MKKAVFGFILILSLALHSNVGFAAGEKTEINLANGKKKYVVLKKVEKEGIWVELIEGAEQSLLKFEELDPKTAYGFKASLIRENDADAHLELGNFCLEKSLFVEARKEFGAARKAKPDLGSKIDTLLEAVSVKEAEAAYSEAVDLFKKGRSTESATIKERNFEKCKDLCTEIFLEYDGTPAAVKARALVDDCVTELKAIEDARLEETKKKQKAEQDKKEKDRMEKVAKEVLIIDRMMDEAEKKYLEAIRTDGDGGRVGNAEFAYRNSIELYQKALLQIKNTVENPKLRFFNDDELKALGEKTKTMERKIIRSNLNMAYMFSFEQQPTKARNYVMKVLELDPENRDALDLRHELTIRRIPITYIGQK